MDPPLSEERDQDTSQVEENTPLMSPEFMEVPKVSSYPDDVTLSSMELMERLKQKTTVVGRKISNGDDDDSLEMKNIQKKSTRSSSPRPFLEIETDDSKDIPMLDEDAHSNIHSARFTMTSKWAMIENLIFQYSFLISIGLQGFLGLFVYLVDSSAFKRHRTHPLLVLFIFLLESAQAVLLVLTSSQIFKRMREGYVGPWVIFNMFLANIASFAGFYTLCYAASKNSFEIFAPEISLVKGNGHEASVWGIWALFLYFSISTMTSAGLGDISPSSWYAQMFVLFQMLFAILYYTGIFAVAIHHFRIYRKRQKMTFVGPNSREDIVVYHSLRKRVLLLFSDPDSRVARFLSRWLLPTTVSLELLNIIVVYSVSGHASSGAYIIFIMCIIQIIQFLIVMWVSFKTVQQLQSKNFMPVLFLSQSYISTIFFFGGLYFSIFFLVGPNTFYIPSTTPITTPDDISLPTSPVRLMIDFLYFSTSCQTSTGLGDIHPTDSSARFVVSIHLLVSAVYSVAILGLGLATFSDHIHGHLSNPRPVTSN